MRDTTRKSPHRFKMHIVTDGDAKDNNETTMQNGYWVEWKKDMYSSVAGAHKGWISHSHFLFFGSAFTSVSYVCFSGLVCNCNME